MDAGPVAVKFTSSVVMIKVVQIKSDSDLTAALSVRPCP